MQNTMQYVIKRYIHVVFCKSPWQENEQLQMVFIQKSVERCINTYICIKNNNE